LSISAADLKRYLLAALGCAVLSAVYECFSHGVCSVWMIGLFLFPLLLGALLALAAAGFFLEKSRIFKFFSSIF